MPRLPPLQLGVLGCCLSRPRGLIPGDTLPPATSSRLLSSVSSAQGGRASERGGGVAALPADQSSEGSLPPSRGGAGAEAAGFHVPGRTALCCWLPRRLPGACPVLQRVTTQGGCGGRQPRCPFWLLDYQCLMGEAGDEDRMGGVGDAVSPGPQAPSAPVLPAIRPRTQASPLVGSEDHHNLWGPPQPEQTSRPSVLVVVTLVFGAVHSPLFGWDPRDRPVRRGLPADAEGRPGVWVQEELPQGALRTPIWWEGPSRLQALQPPDSPAHLVGLGEVP